jgi:hypothetical protein
MVGTCRRYISGRCAISRAPWGGLRSMAQLKTSRFLRSHESKGFGSLKLLKAMSCNLVSPIHKLRFCVAFLCFAFNRICNYGPATTWDKIHVSHRHKHCGYRHQIWITTPECSLRVIGCRHGGNENCKKNISAMSLPLFVGGPTLCPSCCTAVAPICVPSSLGETTNPGWTCTNWASMNVNKNKPKFCKASKRYQNFASDHIDRPRRV